MAGFPQIAYLKNLIKQPNIEIGDYTYYDDPDGPERFLQNVLYHFPFMGDRLLIGKFCAIARGVQFLMNGGNHDLHGFSSYPFFIFGNGWECATPSDSGAGSKGDTVIGHDVWIGYQATILPGVSIGNGAVIGAKAVVSRDVPPYAIVAGNPARVVRYRFDAETIATLQQISWWNWPAEKITRNLPAITGGNLQMLKEAI